MGAFAFWFQFSGFSSNLTRHHETKTAKPIWSSRSKYSNFYFKPRLPMTNEDFLNRFHTFRAVKLQPVWSYRCERCLISRNEHFMKEGHVQASNFRWVWEGIFLLLFVSSTKTRLLRTRVDLCYYCGPFPAYVGEVFKHVCVQTLFLRTFEDMYGYLSISSNLICSKHTRKAIFKRWYQRSWYIKTLVDMPIGDVPKSHIKALFCYSYYF